MAIVFLICPLQTFHALFSGKEGVLMMALQLKNITLFKGSRELLKNFNFTINKGQRVGLLGRNGCGKSTLFKLIVREETPDKGEIVIPESIKVSYLPQGFCEFHKNPHITVKEFLFEPIGRFLKTLAYLERLMSVKSGKVLDNILNDYGKVQAKFKMAGGYEYEENLKIILKKLHIDNHITTGSDMKFLSLSGGQKLKVTLARLLVKRPDLLLLDEPTNYLDIKSLIWLENFLSTFKGAIFVVSHDRKFLDKLSTSIIEISILDGTMKYYSGNYSSYYSQKEKENEKHWQKYSDQREKINTLKSDIKSTKKQAKKTEESTVNDQLRRYAKKVAKKAKSREKRLERLLSDEKRIEKPWTMETVRIKLKSGAKKGKALITIKDLTFKLPDGKTLFEKVSLDLSCGDRVAIIGANGSGKTTFLKTITGRLKPHTGEVIIWPETCTAYLPQDEGEELDLNKTVLEEFRADISIEEGEGRTFLHRMLFKGEDVFKKVGHLSYGERVKLILAKLMASGANTLLLDEPTNHLDMDSLEILESSLSNYEGGLLVISHDRSFLEKISIQRLYVFEEGRLHQYRDYQDYENKIKIQIK